jgi:hypothetical protein
MVIPLTWARPPSGRALFLFGGFWLVGGGEPMSAGSGKTGHLPLIFQRLRLAVFQRLRLAAEGKGICARNSTSHLATHKAVSFACVAGIAPQSGHGSARPRRDASLRASFTWSLLLALAGCAEQQPQQASAPASPAPSGGSAPCSQEGIASWYRGSSRDHTSPQDLVAAHRSLPFGTFVQVTAIETGQSLVVWINEPI